MNLKYAANASTGALVLTVAVALLAFSALSQLGASMSASVAGQTSAEHKTQTTPALATHRQAAVGTLANLASKAERLASNARRISKLNWKVAATSFAKENIANVRRALGLQPNGLAGEFDRNTLVRSLRMVAADTETTGLVDDPAARVIAVGAVHHQGGKVIDGTAQEFRFNPGQEVLRDYLRIDLPGRSSPIYGRLDKNLTESEVVAKALAYEGLNPSSTNLGHDAVRKVREVSGIEVHGIGWQDLRNLPSFADRFEELNQAFKGAIPQGYNGDRFDGPLLRRELAIARAANPDRPELFPTELAPIFRDEVTWIEAQDRALSGLVSRRDTEGRLSLGNIARSFGIGLDEFADPSKGNAQGNLIAHNALSDAEATRIVDEHLIAKVEAELGHPLTYGQLLHDQFRRRASLRSAYERANRYGK